MSEEPVNPFYMYDGADEKYLKDNLGTKIAEWKRYRDWAKRVEEEIDYIKYKLREIQDG